MNAPDVSLNTAAPAADRPAHAAPRGTTLREALTVAFHDRWRIGLAFAAGLVLTAVAAALVPVKYVAEASLLLRLGREYIYTPEVGDPGAGGAPIAYDREQTLLAESRILTSRDLKEMVLKKMGVAQIYPKIAAAQPDPARQQQLALLNLDKGLEADLLKGSNLMLVSFEHADPKLAASVLAEFIEAYRQRRSQVFASSTQGTAQADFAARKAQLAKAEARLEAAKSKRRIRAFAEEQTLLLAQRNALEMRQGDAALAQAQADGRAAALGSRLPGLQSDVTLFSETQRSDAVENARKLLLDLRLKERDLSARFSDSHLGVQDVRADIQRTTEFLRELELRPPHVVRSGRSPARDQAESDLVRTEADQGQARAGNAALARQRQALDARLGDMASGEQELLSLERDRRLAEANYDAATKRLRDETALAELDLKRRSNVSVVQSPQVPLKGKSVTGIVIIVGVMLSLCAALLTAFISALWRDTYLTPEDMERDLGLPLLTSVPEGAA